MAGGHACDLTRGWSDCQDASYGYKLTTLYACPICSWDTRSNITGSPHEYECQHKYRPRHEHQAAGRESEVLVHRQPLSIVKKSHTHDAQAHCSDAELPGAVDNTLECCFTCRAEHSLLAECHQHSEMKRHADCTKNLLASQRHATIDGTCISCLWAQPVAGVHMLPHLHHTPARCGCYVECSGTCCARPLQAGSPGRKPPFLEGSTARY